MWQIFKAWEGLPETKQRATQQEFATKAEADQEADKLRPLFPGRDITVRYALSKEDCDRLMS